MFLLVSVWLAPTASFGGRPMMTDVLTRAIEAIDHMLATGPAGKWPSDQSFVASITLPRSFHTGMDCAAGTILFGIARNKPRPREMLLQVRLGATAPGVGECHFAFPSDWFLGDVRGNARDRRRGVRDGS